MRFGFPLLIICPLFIFISIIPQEFPQEVNYFIQNQPSLPRAAEAGYSLLGRAPVVDAVLGDPFYFPTYARLVSERIKHFSEDNLSDLYEVVLKAGGIPYSPIAIIQENEDVPKEFMEAFGSNIGEKLYFWWTLFIETYKKSEKILSSLNQDEKKWIRDNAEAFFFGEEGKEKYDFFTTNSPMPLKFFELGSRIDLTELSNLTKNLCWIVDQVFENRDELSFISLQDDFEWNEKGVSLIISEKNHSRHDKSADFYLSIGNNNTIANNAGGTEGFRAASLFIDMGGHNTFMGKSYVQGSGVLGIGVLASFKGNNTYKAQTYSQGAGFFGSGILINLEGNNNFKIDFFGQSAAAFGASLLWNKGGKSQFIAHDGMAQAASSTLGVAFLVDNHGNDIFIAGESDKAGLRSSGIAQGASIGVRADPWIGNPSFYGGVSFFYNGGGNNFFKTSWYGQGSAYFLGAGIMVVEGSNNTFVADVNSLGQGLHMAAGLFLNQGGHSKFQGGWGSIGVAGDRSVGIFINTQGNNSYQGTVQSLGTARKPLAMGAFFQVGGNNSYQFENLSNANLQLPQNPLEWPKAIFLQIGNNNSYSESDDFVRGDHLKWGIKNHSIGMDIEIDKGTSLFEKFHKMPRLSFPFDPVNGWSENVSYRSLKVEDIDKMISEIPHSTYDERRRIYESIDLYRFTNPDTKIDILSLMQEPGEIPEDQFNYSVVWAILQRSHVNLDEIARALENNQISSDLSRKLAITILSKRQTAEVASLLGKILQEDSSEENRAIAARVLGQMTIPEALENLKNGLKNPSEAVRYFAAKGLQDRNQQEILDLVLPLLSDESFYVRRAAAMTAISLGYKEGISILLDTLEYNTLDTEENYGDNIFNTLAKYVGVNFGVNKEAWINWWRSAKNTFSFPRIVEVRQVGLEPRTSGL